jgi:hypothetical protein
MELNGDSFKPQVAFGQTSSLNWSVLGKVMRLMSQSWS